MTRFRETVQAAYDAAPVLVYHGGQFVDPNSIVLTDTGSDVQNESGQPVDILDAPDDEPLTLPDELEVPPNQIVVATEDDLRELLTEVTDQFFGGNQGLSQQAIRRQAGHENEHLRYARAFFPNVERILLGVRLYKLPPGLPALPGMRPVGFGAAVHYRGGTVTKLDFAGATGFPMELSPEDRAVVSAYYGSLGNLAVKLEQYGRPLPRSLVGQAVDLPALPDRPRQTYVSSAALSERAATAAASVSVTGVAVRALQAVNSLPSGDIEAVRERSQTAFLLLQSAASPQSAEADGPLPAAAGEITAALESLARALASIGYTRDQVQRFLHDIGYDSGVAAVTETAVESAAAGPAEHAGLPRDMTTETYADAFRRGEPVHLPSDSGLRGRIVRGITDEDFRDLASDGRRLVFVMGPDGLSALPGKPLREALDHIGLPPRYVQGRIGQGYGFRFVVFEGKNEAPPATWDNVLDAVAGEYPELAEDVAAHREALKSTPFAHFAGRMAPHSLDMIQLDGPDNPLFLSLERYLALPGEERRRDPLLLRRLLLHEVGVGTDYTGDGYTMRAGGARGMREYIAPNGQVRELHQPVTLDLSPDADAAQ